MVTEDLIVKFLAGETESHEENLVKEWLKESPENEKQFRDLEKLWVASYALRNNSSVNIDDAWSKVNNRIESRKGKVFLINRKFMAAASVILLLTIGIITFLLSGNKEKLIAMDIRSSQKINLEDGSVVSVNSGYFEYPEKFSASERKVNFKNGKAYFRIAHNKEKPFIVETSGALITVLGTEFEINTTVEFTEVRLTKGRIKFEAGGSEQILTPGMMVRYKKSDGKIELVDQEEKPNDYSYETGVLTFNNTTLSSVVEDLNRFYPGQKIILEGENLADCRLSSVFTNEPLSQVLEVITTTLNLKKQYSEDGKIIILRGEGCNL